MEIEQLRQVPLVDLLTRLGFAPAYRRGQDVWYRSPLREERTASFKVNTDRNVWFDFGLGKGGDIFHLAGELTGSTDFSRQVDFLSGQSEHLPLAPRPRSARQPSASCFEQVKVAGLPHPALKDYLEKRAIPPFLAQTHCREISYSIRGKRYFAIGFANRSGGYEVRNPGFKGCISPKDLSLVPLSDHKQDKCCVFEGVMDFLSALVLGLAGKEDCLVLNSVSNLERSYALLDSYREIRCYLDRDAAGQSALNKLLQRYGSRLSDGSGVYEGSKDLNEHLIKVKENT